MKLFVMSGAFGAGKTTWIGRFLSIAAERCLEFAGVYTPAVFEAGEKVAIDAVLLPQGECFLFAPKRQTAGTDGTERLGWDFRADALVRINAHLSTCKGSKLLIVDELGPLELLRGEGYTQALRLLDGKLVENALVVVRPALLDEARKRWGSYELLSPESSIEGFMQKLQ